MMVALVTDPTGMVLVTVPGVTEVTPALMVQDPVAGTMPLAILNEVAPATAVRVEPVQVVEIAPVGVKPVGRLSSTFSGWGEV